MTVTRALQKIFSGIIIGKKTLLSWESNPVPRDWNHITKIDPEEEKRLPIGYPFYLQHTDAVSVGGSSQVTAKNTEETFTLLNLTDTSVFHEPSEARHVTDATREMAAFLAIPEVLNGETHALVGTLGEGIEYLNDEMVPTLLENRLRWPLYRLLGDSLVDFATSWIISQAVFEAYIVQNPESEAARRSGVTDVDVLTPNVARQRAMVADRRLESEVVYIEYSGTYGGEEAVDVLQSIANDLTRARVWYGGGIDTREKTNEMLAAGADTVIVGDVFHDIADEEVRLVERAVNDLDGTQSPDEFRAWVRDQVDVESTSAARYLRTIPDVARPEQVAEQYFSLTLGLFFAAEASDGETSFSTLPQLVDHLITTPPGGTEHVEEALADREDGFVEYFTDVVLPAVSGGDAEFPVHHLSVSGSAVTDRNA